MAMMFALVSVARVVELAPTKSLPAISEAALMAHMAKCAWS